MAVGRDRKETKLTRDHLKKHKLNPLTTNIFYRKSYKDTFSQGLGVSEQKKDRLSSKEIKNLAKELINE